MARSLIDKIIYSIAKKPKHYVEVKNPPKTAQEKLARTGCGYLRRRRIPQTDYVGFNFLLIFPKNYGHSEGNML